MKKIIVLIIFLIASIPVGIHWWKQSQQRSQLEHELRKAVTTMILSLHTNSLIKV